MYSPPSRLNLLNQTVQAARIRHSILGLLAGGYMIKELDDSGEPRAEPVTRSRKRKPKQSIHPEKELRNARMIDAAIKRRKK